MTQHISVPQMKVLLVFFMIGDMLWFLPYSLTAASKQDAWIVSLIGSLLGIGTAVLLSTLR